MQQINAGSGITSTVAELNILDGVTSTVTELNIVDGDTSAGTTVAGSDGIIMTQEQCVKQRLIHLILDMMLHQKL